MGAHSWMSVQVRTDTRFRHIASLLPFGTQQGTDSGIEYAVWRRVWLANVNRRTSPISMGNNQERRVRVGSRVSVRWTDQEQIEEYTIVPPHEADWQRAMISEASPFGQAVLGQLQGEIVNVRVNGQRCRVTIVAIADPTTEGITTAALTAAPVGIR